MNKSSRFYKKFAKQMKLKNKESGIVKRHWLHYQFNLSSNSKNNFPKKIINCNNKTSRHKSSSNYINKITQF